MAEGEMSGGQGGREVEGSVGQPGREVEEGETAGGQGGRDLADKDISGGQGVEARDRWRARQVIELVQGGQDARWELTEYCLGGVC